jgi:hypothetical protein
MLVEHAQRLGVIAGRERLAGPLDELDLLNSSALN